MMVRAWAHARTAPWIRWIDTKSLRINSTPSPGDQRPGALVNVVERGLGQDLGNGDRAGKLCIPGDQCREHKGVEASGSPPANGFCDGPCMGLGRSDEMKETCLCAPRGGGLYDFDNSESDRVIGLGVN